MAEPLKFTPPKAPTTPSAQDELLMLLEALHENDVLKLLREGVDGATSGLAIILERLDQPKFKETLETLAALGAAVGSIDVEFAHSVGVGLMKASKAAKSPSAPTLLGLLRSVRSREVRRGLGIAVELLSGLGSVPDASHKS